MRKKIITTVIIALAAVLIGGGYLLYQRYYGGAVKFDIETAPIVDFEHRSVASDHGFVSDYLWMRTKQLMVGVDDESMLIPPCPVYHEIIIGMSLKAHLFMFRINECIII